MLQGVHSNYEIDLFQRLIAAAARETGVKNLEDNSLKVIADHIRACSFLIVDGVIPSNEGRGYVLRRIVRRALRHGYKLGQTKPFFHRLVPDLVAEMGEAYPELAAIAERVAQVLKQEEERFGETLEHGMRILDGALAGVAKGGQLDGTTLFTLYDTYGFPVDLTADICRERDVDVDMAGFEAAMERQRDQARAAGKFKMAEGLSYEGADTRFEGYEQLELSGAKVTALYVDGTQVQQVQAGQSAVVVLDATPFYAESGGQVGDTGLLEADGLRFAVADTLKIQAGVFGHHGVLESGTLSVGDSLLARVDAVRRARTVRNHSATHLMHKALRQVLGAHVQQRGSLVDPDKTRFDFAQDAPLTAEQIARVEAIVNAEILANQPTVAQVMPYDDAVKGGAMALFGEIRRHRARAGYRLLARTLRRHPRVPHRRHRPVQDRVRGRRGRWRAPRRSHYWRQCARLGAEPERAADAGRGHAAQHAGRSARAHRAGAGSGQGPGKDLEQSRSKLAASAGNDLASSAAVEVKGIKVLAASIADVDPKALRGMVDNLKDRLKPAVVLLATGAEGKISVVGGVTADLTGRVKAGDLVGFVAGQVGGKGGGRPDMAMGGGTDAAALPAAIASVQKWVEERL